MTEKEAWLEIADKCVETRDDAVFLCHETMDGQMRKRLEMFKPLTSCFVWWERRNDSDPAGEVNDQRATACCFLAAMCDLP